MRWLTRCEGNISLTSGRAENSAELRIEPGAKLRWGTELKTEPKEKFPWGTERKIALVARAQNCAVARAEKSSKGKNKMNINYCKRWCIQMSENI